MDPMGFPNRLNMGGESKEKVKVDSQTLGMKDWKDSVVMYSIQS